jgi:phosphoribosylformylglycinamidine synthase
MADVRVLILRTAGTNCDCETEFAFSSVGAKVERIHINRLVRRENVLDDYQILAVPGGFTYGDDVASGKILANELRYNLRADIERFIENGKLIIGICNGFQVFVKAGILPGFSTYWKEQEVTLTLNDSGRLEDRWVYLKVNGEGVSRCVWTEDLPEVIHLPVAHGEGKFVARDEEIYQKLKRSGHIVFQYVNPDGGRSCGYPFNPNGSVMDIAGICDGTGRILGLMPHPERHFLPTHHPRWTREGLRACGDGKKIFENGVRYVRKHL